MVYGRMERPVEGDVGLRATDGGERWYRVVAVPIFDKGTTPRKTVLHLKNITAQKHEELALLRSAQRDPLCGLLNRNALLKLADKRRRAPHVTAAMFFIDLDNFKLANDRLGHAAGDGVLLAAAGILKEIFRGTDLICRYGGDEFVAFVADITREAAEARARELVRRLRFRHPLPEGGEVAVSASVGVWLSGGTEDTESLIHKADEAMYRAKQDGKARYVILTDPSGQRDNAPDGPGADTE